MTDPDPTTPDPTTELVVPDSDPSRTANAEAARYRVRAREAEAVRDALAARVQRFERAAVERVAAETLSTPGDVWLFAFTAPDTLPRTEDGEVDTDAVRAAVARVTEGRPGLAIPPKRIPDMGGGLRGDPLPSEPTWSSIINPSARNA